MKLIEKGLDSSIKQALDRLDKEIEKVATKNYSFYTDGHPYVWCNTTKEEIQKAIKDSIRARKGHPNNYLLEISDEKKAIYFVQIHNDNNWKNLMHYQEWLDSQKQVAENIAKHKNS